MFNTFSDYYFKPGFTGLNASRHHYFNANVVERTTSGPRRGCRAFITFIELSESL